MRGGRRWIWITGAAVSVSLVALAAGALLPGGPGPARELAQTVSRPVQRVYALAGAQVRRVTDRFTSLEALQEENSRLREENLRLSREARLGELAQGENSRLRSLLELEETNPALTLTDAWVLSRSADPWRAEVTLDRGADAGLRAGQCVVDASKALIGRVSETGENWCRVTLITDPAFTLAGQGSKTEGLGSLTGRLDRMEQGELTFTPLGAEGGAQLGEGILSFSQGGRYPGGLLVGTVTSLEEDPGGLSSTAIITPSANLNDLGQVFVVTAWGTSS